jgi:hypothetical protein
MRITNPKIDFFEKKSNLDDWYRITVYRSIRLERLARFPARFITKPVSKGNMKPSGLTVK